MLCTDSLLYLTAAAVWISVFVVIIASVVVVVVVASLLEIFVFTWLIERFVIVVYHSSSSSSPGDGLCVFSRSLEVCCCVFLLSIGHHIFIIMLVINYFCFHLERCMMITIASWSTTVRYNIANHFFGCSCSCVMCHVCSRNSNNSTQTEGEYTFGLPNGRVSNTIPVQFEIS